MPARWFIGTRGEAVSFEDAPEYFEGREVMPAFAVKAIIKELADKKPSFHVRPSDVVPDMTCRRQRVWEAAHDYGVDPQLEEPQLEGSLFHEKFESQEINVPEKFYLREVDGEGNQVVLQERLEVCGVPMRGRIDWMEGDLITDLKTTTPYFYAKFQDKSARQPGVYAGPKVVIWEPDPDADIAKWQIQLSIYGILLLKAGRPAPKRGRVWKRYSGVKTTEHKRWQRFDFPLLTEEQLERKVGPWMRELQAALTRAEDGDLDAWKDVPADGLQIVSKRGKKWACMRCSLQVECAAIEGVDVW